MATKSNTTKTTGGNRGSRDQLNVATSIATMMAANVDAASAATELKSRHDARSKTIKSPSLDAISFIKKRGREVGGYNYWADVPVAETYSADCETGRRLAEEFITFIATYPNYGNGSLLGSIMIDMEENGATHGHKIGFMNTINKHAMGGGYLASLEIPTPEHSWTKARRLGKELSTTLAECDDGVCYGYIRPAGTEFAVLFGSLDTSPEEPEPAVTRVERLSEQLSVALDDWNAQTNTSFMAHVPPASSGRGFYYENMRRDRELPRGSEAVSQIGKLLGEVSRIIRNEPGLKIERISINEHGVHTFHKLPDFEPAVELDPLREAIEAYRAGVRAMSDLPAGAVTHENEDDLVESTYGAPQRTLLEWDQPAVTKEGAIEALKFMGDERMFIDNMGEPLRLAVLRFLEAL